MANDYYTILTSTGRAKIAQAMASGQKMTFRQFALGDGAGSAYDPTEEQTALKHEVYRAAITTIKIADASTIEISMLIPADVGGWTVREMGVFDNEGDLIAIAKTPDELKPNASSGLAKEVTYYLYISVVNTDAVEITIDPAVVGATKAELQDHVNNGAVHITQDERTAISEATTKGAQLQTQLDAHKEDQIIHVTQAERDSWNSTSPSGDQTTTIKADGTIVTETAGTVKTTSIDDNGTVTTIALNTVNQSQVTTITRFAENEAGETVIIRERVENGN